MKNARGITGTVIQNVKAITIEKFADVETKLYIFSFFLITYLALFRILIEVSWSSLLHNSTKIETKSFHQLLMTSLGNNF